MTAKKTPRLAGDLLVTKGEASNQISDLNTSAAADAFLTFKCSPEFKKEIKILAAQRGIMLKTVLAEALEGWIEKNKLNDQTG